MNKVVTIEQMKTSLTKAEAQVSEIAVAAAEAIVEVADSIPSKVSQLSNDTGYITGVDTATESDIEALFENVYEGTELQNDGYLVATEDEVLALFGF